MAKKKEEFVSVAQVESLINKNNQVRVPLTQDESIVALVTPVISLDKMIAFVQNVYDSCIDEETGRYIPEAYDFAIRANVISLYSNIRLPVNTEKQYDVLFKTRIYDQVVNAISSAQFYSIEQCLEDKIKHELSVMREETNMQLRALIRKIDEFSDHMSNVFGEVESEDMGQLVQNLSKMTNVDETALVRAVFDQKNALKSDSESAIEEREIEVTEG